MGRTPGAKNKPKGETVKTDTAEHQTMPQNYTEADTRAGGTGQDVAIFQPARLPYHPAIEERFGLDKGTWKVLVEAIFPAAKSVDAIVMALSYCKSRGLDIMKRPVHIVPMYDSARGGYVETIWPGISELRTTASRTKGYGGCDEAQFGPEKKIEFTGRVKRNGAWVDEKATVEFPEWCRITVYRMVDGQRCKFVGPKVSWMETYATQGNSDLPNKMWQERPEGQLEKCAEAAALRRAFPEEMGNELTAEEMEGRRLHDLTVDAVTAPAAADRDAGPPRAIAAPVSQNDTEEVRDGTPPPRQTKPAATDPISSGPPRTTAPAKQTEPPRTAAKETGPAEPEIKPHRIPGDGHTFETWAEKYCDLIKTSPDIATVYSWIDANTKEFKIGDGPKQAGPLDRLQKGKPSVYAQVKKVTEQTMEALRDAQKKAADKAAKKAKPTAAPPAGDMDDGPAIPPEDFDALTGAGSGPEAAPTDPEAILAAIDAELAAVEDPDLLQDVWDKACDPLVEKLVFPPDQDLAQGLFDKHSKRLGGD